MSDPHDLQAKEDRKLELHKRDAETQIALGLFIVIIAIPVLIGTIYAVRPHAQVVNMIAGGVLLAIGAGLAWFGWRNRRRLLG
ncbi:MAG: YtpI family protein [FCB group bacterium]|jgi:hypothetical protein|nr:YtpI family protein [FCB group bacterium]